EHVALDARVDLGVREHGVELLGAGHAVAQLAEVGVHLLQPALVARRLEEGARVDALRGGYDLLPSSCEKSISASASSIRRRWSSASSDLRVIFSAAATLSLPTSSRISPSAWCVACSICRRVSSSRRCRSSSVSARTRSRWASATWRAS